MQRDFFSKHRQPSFRLLSEVLAFPITRNSISVEELTDGKARVEAELCFVGRIADPTVLQKAARIERQEERELFLTPKGDPLMARLRVRRSTVNGQSSDVLTFKVRRQGEQFSKESSLPAPEGLFEVMGALPGVRANDKTRHVFPTELPGGEVWEVDLYPDDQGGFNTWVKIDFEFCGSTSQALPPFPDGIVDILDSKTGSKEDRAFVDNLFQTVFYSKQAA